MVEHARPPLQTVRVVLKESSSNRIRVSSAAKLRLEHLAEKSGRAVWAVVDELLGVE